MYNIKVICTLSWQGMWPGDGKIPSIGNQEPIHIRVKSASTVASDAPLGRSLNDIASRNELDADLKKVEPPPKSMNERYKI